MTATPECETPLSKPAKGNQLIIAAMLLAILCAPATLQAQESAAAQRALEKRPEAVQALFACRLITEASQRLACFDTKSADLEHASDAREVVMVDKEQVRETRRSLFGLSLPSLKLFGSGKGSGEQEEITEVEGVIASASQQTRGRWLLVLEDGAKWLQSDSRALARYPRKGSAIKIRAAALGSYLANIDGQTAIRVKRVN